MNINFSKLGIDNKEKFVNYFIYYYEYTFLQEESSNINVKKEISAIVNNSKIEDFERLWYYTRLKYNQLISKDFQKGYLSETINKIISDIEITPIKILDTQTEIINGIYVDLEISILEERPYEQFKTSVEYLIRYYEKELVNFFRENIDNFSEIKINKARYLKTKDCTYIDFPTIIYELFSIVLYEQIKYVKTCKDIKEGNNLENVIKFLTKEFAVSFKKEKKVIDLTKLNDLSIKIAKNMI